MALPFSSTQGAMLSFAFALAMAIVASPSPRSPAEPVSSAVSELEKCRGLREDAVRLACYDKGTAAFTQAQTSGDVIVVDRAQIKAVKRQAFGLRLPTLDLLPHAGKDAGLDRINVTLKSAGRQGDGNWILDTDEDTQWVQTDGLELAMAPHAGSKLSVRSGALGSFFCRIDGQASVRCRRAR